MIGYFLSGHSLFVFILHLNRCLSLVKYILWYMQPKQSADEVVKVRLSMSYTYLVKG